MSMCRMCSDVLAYIRSLRVMNKYIFLYFNLLGLSVSCRNIVQTSKLCVTFRVYDSLWLLKRQSHHSCSVWLQWEWEDYCGWWMKMWDTAWIKVLSDVAVAHDDEYKAIAAAAEHFNTKVVLKGTLVQFINILNYKNVMNEVPGPLLSAVLFQWNHVLLVLCRVDLGFTV